MERVDKTDIVSIDGTTGVYSSSAVPSTHCDLLLLDTGGCFPAHIVRPMAVPAGNFERPSVDGILIRGTFFILSTIYDQAPQVRSGIVRVEDFREWGCHWILLRISGIF